MKVSYKLFYQKIKVLFMRNFLYLFLLFFTISCQINNNYIEEQKYLRWVGDIEYNNKIDASNFKICNGEENVLQYFSTADGPVYSNEKSTILKLFKTNYLSQDDNTQNGLIRIRFIVNCEGKANRFRILESNNNYEEFQFNKEIVSRLLKITNNIEDWPILYKNNLPVDYYKYLIFKIKNGQIVEILP